MGPKIQDPPGTGSSESRIISLTAHHGREKVGFSRGQSRNSEDTRLTPHKELL